MNIRLLFKGFIRIFIAALLFIFLCACEGCPDDDDDDDNDNSKNVPSVSQDVTPSPKPETPNPIDTPEGAIKKDTTGQSDASGVPSTGEAGSSAPACQTN